MSMFEETHYRWRETYFVLFDARKRPSLERMKKALAALSKRYQLQQSRPTTPRAASSRSRCSRPTTSPPWTSATSAARRSASRSASCVAEHEAHAAGARRPGQAQADRPCDGRFDVLHFEQITDAGDEEDDEMLDPSAVLIVLDALARLTDGMAVDPQSGTIM